ncbi:MAG: hypothetical protein F4Y94_07430 [Chloroflexi bacterium]|nr:hypothetical protein [Chloroflexota bacterium]
MVLSAGGPRPLSSSAPSRLSAAPARLRESVRARAARRLSSALAPSSTDQVIDPRLTAQRVRRLAELDTAVFREVRDDAGQTLAAALVVVGSLLLAALGGWLWLIVEVDGLSTGRILAREVALGLLCGAILWGVWVMSTHLMLRYVFGRETTALSLVRTMGHAAFPAAGAAFMIVPALGFAVGMLSVLAWFASSNAAIEAAAPGATRREALVANLAGFALFVVLMSVLADAAGIAPGFFVHAADLSVYV